jgi:hypothetical protein
VSELARSLTEYRDLLRRQLERGARAESVALLEMRMRFVALAIISGH